MASFITNMFPAGGKSDKAGSESPTRPGTPSRNSFINPISTPQGSPSKKMAPPGAHELPVVMDGLRLGGGSNANILDPPLKLGRPQSVIVQPLASGKSNAPTIDEFTASGSLLAADESIVHKSGGTPGSPGKKDGKENTAPSRLAPLGTDPFAQHNHAAASRQELYQIKEHSQATPPPPKKFNTTRGLTPEELEKLNSPQVKRLVNVTQLCKVPDGVGQPLAVPVLICLYLPLSRLSRLLFRPSDLCW